MAAGPKRDLSFSVVLMYASSKIVYQHGTPFFFCYSFRRKLEQSLVRGGSMRLAVWVCYAASRHERQTVDDIGSVGNGHVFRSNAENIAWAREGSRPH